MRTQLSNILEILLLKNSIRLHPEEIKFQVSSHPSYPSLHALTGVLQHFGIPNLAIQLPTTAEILNELPPFFIAHILEGRESKLALVEKVNNQIKVTFDKNKTEKRSVESFLNVWDGITVAIEKDDAVIESYPSYTNKFLTWGFVTICTLILGYFIYVLPGTFASGHFFLSIIGLIFNVFIIRHELGLDSSLLENICNLSSATSCDTSLNSKGAMLFGKLKLSDLSILTFSSYLLFWFLLFKNSSFDYSVLSIVTLLAIPFAVYSVYYQFKIVEKWCPLCLGIVTVLLLQSLLLIFDSNVTLVFTPLDWKPIALLTLSGILCTGIWRITRPQLERTSELSKLEIDHYKFKRNYTLFKTLHDKGKALVKPYRPILGEINFGNKNAPTKIILITSPLCRYCKQAHTDIEHLIEKAKNKIHVTIRFTVNVARKEDQNYLIASRLIQLYNSKNLNDIEQALKEVFSEHIDRKKWLLQFNGPIDSKFDTILQKQSEWCSENSISFTPAFYVNGKMYPNEYDRTDIIYFIDELIEQQNTDNTLENKLTKVG